jgi:hypothetical protein
MMFTYDSVKYHVKKSHKITLKQYRVSTVPVYQKQLPVPNKLHCQGSPKDKIEIKIVNFFGSLLLKDLWLF